VVEDGYEFFAKRQLVTLFSAPNYCGEFDNAGGMMSVDETLMCSFQVSYFSSFFYIKGDFFGFFHYFIQHYFICRPSESTVSEHAGIEPTLTTRLVLIHLAILKYFPEFF
jgi:hypothetical protein